LSTTRLGRNHLCNKMESSDWPQNKVRRFVCHVLLSNTTNWPRQPLKPTVDEILRVLAAAKGYWESERVAALQKLKVGFVDHEYTLLWAQDRIPPLPSSIELNDLIFATLTTKWSIDGPKDCSVTGSVLDIPGPRIELSSSAPVSVSLNGDCFQRWTVSPSAQCSNIISVLALAWCYVLSVRWLESLGTTNPPIVYSDFPSTTKLTADKVPNLPIRTGFNDSRRLRWLCAILTPGSGYIPTLPRSNAGRHWSPWAVSLTMEDDFTISVPEIYVSSAEGDLNKPLTSFEALDALKDLCLENQIPWMQIEASLGVALLVPLHRALGAPLRLPRPQQAHNPGFDCSARLDLASLNSSLPSLMTFSSCYELINSTLCGAFWNPSLSSNLASPWIQALEDACDAVDDTNVHSHRDEILALMGARRAPPMGVLFIAAAVTRLLPTISAQVRSGQPPLERHAFPWTGVPQSFMDVGGSGDYGIVRESGTYLRRSDCWRLRRLPPSFDDDLHYAEGPFSPWEPPGECLAANCPLRVQNHLKCSRHWWRYESCVWHLDSGGTINVTPRKTGSAPFHLEVPFDHEQHVCNGGFALRDEDASFDATVSVFRWVLDNDEGIPSEDAYRDPWIRGICNNSDTDDSDTCEDESANNSTGGTPCNGNIDKWFDVENQTPYPEVG